MNAWGEFISLWLTWPTVILGLGVVFHWFREAIKALCTSVALRSRSQWLLLGIFLGFAGSDGDNIYWCVAWSAEYLGLESKTALFKTGCWPNIFLRQLAGIFAAYCHMRAYYEGMKDERKRLAGLRKLHLLSLFSFALGGVYALVLYLLR
jgi:hypothetical protein